MSKVEPPKAATFCKKKQIKLAVDALLAYLREYQEKKGNQLFESNDTIFLQLALKKLPDLQKRTKKIPLPHSIREVTEVCLISKEPGKVVKQKLQDAGVTQIAKVISLEKLRKEYKTFALKRQLADSYDVFLCDDRIYNLVLKNLGKTFAKAHKEPLAICCTRNRDLSKEIKKTLTCTLLQYGIGPSSSLRVGHSGQPSDELVENVAHAAKLIATKIPRGVDNIKSLYLKSDKSIALPLYNSVTELKPTRKRKSKVRGDKSEDIEENENAEAAPISKKVKKAPENPGKLIKKRKKKSLS